jgi:hypothetical protein
MRSRRCSTNPHCAAISGVVREGQCHSVTLCHPLPCLLHVAPLESGQRYPRKGYDHQLRARPGRRHDVRPAERISSITSATSGPVRPCPALCHEFRHCKAIPNTVGTQVDGTSPRLPLCSFRSPVSQALELVYRRRSDKDSSATTLEAAPGPTQESP